MGGKRQPLLWRPQSLAQPLPVPLTGVGPTPATLVEPDFTMFPSPLPPLSYTKSSEQVCFHGNHTVTQGFGTFSEPDYEYQMLRPRTNAE